MRAGRLLCFTPYILLISMKLLAVFASTLTRNGRKTALKKNRFVNDIREKWIKV
jgi:hypothetical protein